jgi:tetratricopeptide (TPR) repeat protein
VTDSIGIPDPGVRLRDLMLAGNFAPALDCFREHTDELTDPEAIVMAATAAARVGQYGTARALVGRALDGFNGRGDRIGAVACLNLQGGIEFEQGELDLAERAFHQALTLADAGPGAETSRAKLWNNLGSIAHLRGDDQRAVEHYADALQIYATTTDARGTAQTAHNLAVRLAALGDLERALEYATEAVRHAARVPDPALRALVTAGRAEILIECGDWPAAQGDIFAALTAAGDARDPVGIAEGLRLRAEVALRRGEHDFARRQAEIACREAVAVGAVITAAECGGVLALALRSLGRTGDAEARFNEAIARFRSAGAIHPMERFLSRWHAA